MMKTGVCCQLFGTGIFAYRTINNVFVLILKAPPEDKVVLNICMCRRDHGASGCV